MKRWSRGAGGQLELPAVDAFLEEVLAVARKHGFAIAHEDEHGGFVIVFYDERTADWLRAASVDFREKEDSA
jgi:hypothetical protein